MRSTAMRVGCSTTGRGTEEIDQRRGTRDRSPIPLNAKPFEAMSNLHAELLNATGTDLPIAGGDGSSLEQAIVLVHHPMGYPAQLEHAVLNALAKARGFRWRLERQALMNANGRAYDRMEIMTVPGGPATYYFDITAYW